MGAQDAGVYLVKGMYRNRRLLDLAHQLERCANCGLHSVGGCEPAHSDMQEHGRGKDNKSHDCFFAALCHACHGWYDFSGANDMDPSRIYRGTRDGKREMFVRAMGRTWFELWRLELVRVA